MVVATRSKKYAVREVIGPKGYVVTMDFDGVWRCSCPAWIYHTPRKDCKHIDFVKEAFKAGYVHPAEIWERANGGTRPI